MPDGHSNKGRRLNLCGRYDRDLRRQRLCRTSDGDRLRKRRTFRRARRLENAHLWDRTRRDDRERQGVSARRPRRRKLADDHPRRRHRCRIDLHRIARKHHRSLRRIYARRCLRQHSVRAPNFSDHRDRNFGRQAERAAALGDIYYARQRLDRKHHQRQRDENSPRRHARPRRQEPRRGALSRRRRQHDRSDRHKLFGDAKLSRGQRVRNGGGRNIGRFQPRCYAFDAQVNKHKRHRRRRAKRFGRSDGHGLHHHAGRKRQSGRFEPSEVLGSIAVCRDVHRLHDLGRRGRVRQRSVRDLHRLHDHRRRRIQRPVVILQCRQRLCGGDILQRRRADVSSL